MKTVFIHPERCIGCKQCEAACAVEPIRDTKNLFWAVFETPSCPRPASTPKPGLAMNTSFPEQVPPLQPGSVPARLPNRRDPSPGGPAGHRC